MSTAEVVEQRSLTTQSSHQHLAFDDIEVTGFRLGFASHSHRASHMSVINVDDDASEAAGNTRPRSHLASQPSFSISGDNGPPATRRRSAEDHPVIVIDNTGSRETRTQRGTNNGAESSPIIVLDSDEEQGSASSSHQRRRRRGESLTFFARLDIQSIISCSPCFVFPNLFPSATSPTASPCSTRPFYPANHRGAPTIWHPSTISKWQPRTSSHFF